MNIGVDVRLFAEGRQSGVEEYTEQLLRALIPLAPADHFTLFFNVAKQSADTRLDFFETLPNVTIKRFRIPNKILNTAMAFFDYPKLDTLVGGVDLWFSPNMIFSRVSESTPSILTVHDIAFNLLPESLSLKRKLWHDIVDLPNLIQRARHLIAVSEATARDLVVHYGVSQKKISVVHSGLRGAEDASEQETVTIQKKYNLPEKYFLFFATLEPRKNAATLVAAYEQYRRKSLQPVKLVFAGSAGWLTKKLVEEVTHSSLTKDCIFTGEVSEKEKTVLYRNALALIYPSLYEGFGFPPLEAMREGTPVITTSGSSLPEIVDGAALLVDPYDIYSLCEALLVLEQDQSVQQRLIDAGHQCVAKYSWKSAAEKTLEVFHAVA